MHTEFGLHWAVDAETDDVKVDVPVDNVVGVVANEGKASVYRITNPRPFTLTSDRKRMIKFPDTSGTEASEIDRCFAFETISIQENMDTNWSLLYFAYDVY